MTEVAVFGIGSVMFMATTWATFAFGMKRVHQLQMRDLASSDRIAEVRRDNLTELHMTVQPLHDQDPDPREDV